MKNFNEELFKFIKKSTCAFTCISTIKDILLKNNYRELKENETWNLNGDKFFVIRNDASIIAFNISNIKTHFDIVCTHSDTPAFTIKPNPDFYEEDYLKLNVAPYGGLLNYGFLDRPLGLSGRLILKNNNTYKTKVFDLNDNFAIIPSLAIHQNSTANTNLDLNSQIDLMPIISLNKNNSLKKILKNKLNLKEEIYDYDLFLYVLDNPKTINEEFIASPRIDNITCTFASLKAFLNTHKDGINVLSVFNSEEIGSNTKEGADSNFLIDTLKKICKILNLDLTNTLASSFILSADNTHARHPNHNEIKDHTNNPPLNCGIIITKDVNGTTNGITSTIFKHICDTNKIPYSYATYRNDFTGGGTQAGASLRHLSINSLDIGLAMLAMHSGVEIIGIKDTYYLYKALHNFYKTNYSITNNKITFK